MNKSQPGNQGMSIAVRVPDFEDYDQFVDDVDYEDGEDSGHEDSRPERSSARSAGPDSSRSTGFSGMSLRKSLSMKIFRSRPSASDLSNGETNQVPRRVESTKERASLNRKSALKLGLDLEGNDIASVELKKRYSLTRSFSSNRFR